MLWLRARSPALFLQAAAAAAVVGERCATQCNLCGGMESRRESAGVITITATLHCCKDTAKCRITNAWCMTGAAWDILIQQQ
jgi:hypothetical protein